MRVRADPFDERAQVLFRDIRFHIGAVKQVRPQIDAAEAIFHLRRRGGGDGGYGGCRRYGRGCPGGDG